MGVRKPIIAGNWKMNKTIFGASGPPPKSGCDEIKIIDWCRSVLEESKKNGINVGTIEIRIGEQYVKVTSISLGTKLFLNAYKALKNFFPGTKKAS